MKDMDIEQKKALNKIREIKHQYVRMVQEQGQWEQGIGETIQIEAENAIGSALYFPGEKEQNPVYIHIHGGGFAWGDMSNGAYFCQRLQKEHGFVCFSLEYPLMPDVVYPEAIQHLYSMIRNIYHHAEEWKIDQNRIFIGGESAGAQLAGALCYMLQKKDGISVKGQVLNFPLIALDEDSLNKERIYHEKTMSRELVETFSFAYASKEQRREPYVTLMNIPEKEAATLPPAVIQGCEYDCLLADSKAYAEKLQNAGVAVIYQCVPQAEHGFTGKQDITAEKGRDFLIQGMLDILNADKLQNSLRSHRRRPLG